MTSPRLRLWQVLRDEYESFHGAPPALAHNWRFQPAQLKHAVGLARRLHQPADKVSKYLFGKLSVESQTELQDFDGKTTPSDELQADLLDKLNQLLNNPDLRQLYETSLVNQILT